jgi:glycerophosphoryl diester phosphodiesterase
MLRVGHGGAGALARPNTLESFEVALEHEVDMIEFDVRAYGGDIVLAHSPWEARLRRCPTLVEALSHLSRPRFADLHFDVDVKQRGLEAPTLSALERFGLTDRCLISSRIPAVLDRVRALDPRVKTGISIAGRLSCRKQGWPDWRPAVLAAIEQKRFDAVMAHHRMVDRRLLDGMRERAAELFAWTVDDRALIDRLRHAGVSGVISNDPRLFQPAVAG